MSKYVYLVAILALCSVGAFAQSSKATAAINTAVWCTYNTSGSASDTGVASVNSCTDLFSGAEVTETPDHFIQVMSSTIKVSNSQSLFVTPSLVTGLYTNTAVKNHTSGGTGSTSTAVAMGGVYLRAVLYDSDGNMIVAYPINECSGDILGCQLVPSTGGTGSGYGVVLDSRIQTLSQTLSGCTVSTGGTCSFDLTTQLILQTATAHTFGFIFPNVGVGTYTVSIQAAVNSNANTSGTAYAVGASAFGLGSVTVESVRLVHGFSF
ncbi:MAG: hypothetical protein ACLGRW_11645 [Acidobacteriota bacterium]|jgi:hypothetical protein